MCGIFFSLSRRGYISPDKSTVDLLHNRGPDFIKITNALIEQGEEGSSDLYATFLSTVLSLRGAEVVKQPVTDHSSGCTLCWNGEAWSVNSESITGSDTKVIYDLLIKAASTGGRPAVIELLSNVRGPYAIIFWDRFNKCLYYGRDCLGRRSLLKKVTTDGSLLLSSVCDNTSGEGWEEVEADGIYMLDLGDVCNSFAASKIPHLRMGEKLNSALSFKLPFPPLNREEPVDHGPDRQKMLDLGESLRQSVALRTRHVREAFEASPSPKDEVSAQAAKIAVLFSGGLDCTVLARLCHDLIPLNESIDLLNVAFENPRIHGNLEAGISPYEFCPDRITGRASHAELQQVCPNRQWRFVEVNVPYTETVAHRQAVMTLMHPHNTEMDLSISYALYFASRGVGLKTSSPIKTTPQPYATPAHVLLSGLGADELFGGYQRHMTAFSRRGYPGLLDELQLDLERLGKRNLGRDDRVISNSGREVRFPFLDESFIAMALQLPVAEKCDFGRPEYKLGYQGEDVLIEPAKFILRCLAYELGMRRVATEKKRAIQFGARTAKMETGKTKGTHVLT